MLENQQYQTFQLTGEQLNTLCYLIREHPITALCEQNFSFPWEDQTNRTERGKYEAVDGVLGRECDVAGQTWLGASPDDSFVEPTFFQKLVRLTHLNNWMNCGPRCTKSKYVPVSGRPTVYLNMVHAIITRFIFLSQLYTCG